MLFPKRNIYSSNVSDSFKNFLNESDAALGYIFPGGLF